MAVATRKVTDVNRWRDSLPAFTAGALGTAGGIAVLAYFPGDRPIQLITLSLVAIFAAILGTVVLAALGVSGRLLQSVIPVGVVTGSALLMLGFAIGGVLWQWLLWIAIIEVSVLALSVLWLALHRWFSRLIDRHRR